MPTGLHPSAGVRRASEGAVPAGAGPPEIGKARFPYKSVGILGGGAARPAGRRGWGAVAAEYTRLGRSGLAVSRLVLGTMNFGPEADGRESRAVMRRAHEHGVNFSDTANVYGTRPGETSTEEVIGRGFAGDPERPPEAYAW